MYAAIYIPDFPVEAVIRHEPDLRTQAVAIVEGVPPSCTVKALNDRARAAGVRFGMTRLQAGQFPGVQIRQRSAAQEAAAHAALLDLGWSVSPRVESTAPDTIVADIAGLEHLFGSPEQIAGRLAGGLAQLALDAHVAVAANPDAAVHMARGCRGVNVIPASEESRRLENLPVEVLALDMLAAQAKHPGLSNGLLFSITQTNDSSKLMEEVLAAPPETLHTLRRWGIRTLGQLARLPAVGVAERLGEPGVHLQRLARGAHVRTLVPAEPVQRFEEIMELDDPVELLDHLAFVLGRLLDQICARLMVRVLATNELRLHLCCESINSEAANQQSEDIHSQLWAIDSSSKTEVQAHRLTLRLPIPTRDSKLLLKLWLLRLKAEPPPAPVIKIALMAVPVEPRVTQGGLFLPASPDPEKLELTLARIAGIVGKDNVGSPQIEDTHRPGAFRMTAFVAPAADQQSIFNYRLSSSEQKLGLRIFRPPLSATVELRDGRPSRIFARGPGAIRGEIVASAGPWRTSGDWWRGSAWAQDEWDVEVRSLVRRPRTIVGSLYPGSQQIATNGSRTALYRIYRDLHSGEWFVRGSYD
jgi:protein ImuB